MTVARDALYGLYGATRLARFDRAGTGYFDGTVDSAWRSFWANLFILPAYWILILLPDGGRGEAVGLLPYLTVETLSFAVKLLAYLLIVQQVMEMQGKADRVPAFIAAYNWASVLQMGAFLLGSALVAGELLPLALASAINTVFIVWAVALGWFIARHTLDIPALGAVGIVGLELFVAAFINGVTDSMVWGQG